MASQFAYFGGLVFFVLFLYTVVLAIFLCIRRHNIKKAIEYRNVVRGTNDAQQERYDRANFSWEFRTDFDHVSQSALGKGCKWFLALQRTACFVVFFVAAVYLNAIKDNSGLVYFTNWNSLLVTLYFGLASAASIIGMWAKSSRTEYGMSIGAGIRWSYGVRCLGVAVHTLFEVVGASSMFVMIFDYFYIHENNPDMMSVMNFLRALAVVVLVFELFLNNINVRFDQYPATIAWTVMYLLFVWPAVFTGAMEGWPYRLLQTRTKTCFVYYFLIFFFNFLLYVLWWGVYKLKKSIYIKYNIGRYMDYGEEETEISHHEFMLLERTMNPLSMHGTAEATEVTGAQFFTDEDDGHSVAYTIDGFPIDLHGDEVGMYAEEAGLLYHPDGYNQNGAYYAEDGTLIYPDSNYYPEQPFSPGAGYMADGGESYYGSGPYSYEAHSPLVRPDTGYPDPHRMEFQNRQPWAAGSPQYAGHWDYGDGGGPHGSHGMEGEDSGYYDAEQGGYYDDGAYPMDEGLTPTGRTLPARPYAGSALQRGRGGGRGAGRRDGGAPVTQQPSEPINVTAEALDDDAVAEHYGDEGGAQEGAAGFDYSEVDAWQSFNASGAIPHTAAEAGIKAGKKGGLFSQFGWGTKGGTTAAAAAGQKRSTDSKGNDGQQEYDEEFEFGDADGPDSHKSGAFIASAAKKEAFHVPGILKNARRKSGDPAHLASQQAQAQQGQGRPSLPRPPSGKKMFRPPSVPRMFRPASKESLNLQSLGPASASPHGSSFRRTPSSARMSRQGSMEPQYAEPGFDYSEMDAWASFNARGTVPHNPDEADLGAAPTIRVGGVGPLDPHSEEQRSGEKGGNWFDHGDGVDEGDIHSGDEFMHEGHHFIPQSTADTHKTGAFIAISAKKEAFHAPPTGASARSHHAPSSAASPTAPSPQGSQKASSGSVLRPPSLGNLFRASSRDKLPEGRRTLNLQSLGGPAAVSSASAKEGGGMFRPGSVTRMFRSQSKEAIVPPSNINNSSFRRTPSSARMSRQGSMEPQYAEPGFDYSEMDAWASFNARGTVPHNPDEADLGAAPTIRVGGVGPLDPHSEEARSGEKGGSWFDHGDGGEEDDARSGDEFGHEGHHYIPQSTADTHKTGAYIASSAKKEAFHAPPGGAGARSHHAPSSAASPAARSPQGGQKASSGGVMGNLFRASSRDKLPEGRRTLNLRSLGGPAAANPAAAKEEGGMFRPGSVTRMFRSHSKEALTPPSNINNSSFRRTPSSARMGRQGSMEPQYAEPGFDYSEMDAWASFNARGTVPHRPDEADLGAAPTIRVGGVGHLDPHSEVPQKGSGWFDNAHEFGDNSDEDHAGGQENSESHFVPQSTADTHKFGAYIATAAQKDAFRAPSNPLRAPAPGASRNAVAPGRRVKASPSPAPATAPPAQQAPTMFRAPSVPKMFRPSSRGDVTQPPTGAGPGRRAVNLQALGGATQAGRRAPSPSGNTGNTAPMFRPPSVTRLFRANSRDGAEPAPAAQSPLLNTAGGTAAKKGAVASKGSFFDYPTADGANEGSESGDSDDAFKM
jgi:predicted RecA/RadA family phage recombinase